MALICGSLEAQSFERCTIERCTIKRFDVKMADLIRMSDLVIHLIFVKMTTDMLVARTYDVKMADIGKAQNHVKKAKMASFAETETKQNKTKQTPFLRNFEMLFLT